MTSTRTTEEEKRKSDTWNWFLLNSYWIWKRESWNTCLTDIHPRRRHNPALLSLFEVESQPHGDINRESGVEGTQVALIIQRRVTDPLVYLLMLYPRCSYKHSAQCLSPVSAAIIGFSVWGMTQTVARVLLAQKVTEWKWTFLPQSSRLCPDWSWELSSPSLSRRGTPPPRDPWLFVWMDYSPTPKLVTFI